jgi:REP element-mobilizing transposase RayT
MQGAAHVVLRLRRGLPSLRTPRAYRVLERAFRRGKRKDGYRLVEFSVQRDHLHLVVEAEGRERLSLGMQGLMIRIAKALNRFWHRRRGAVFADRYFALALKKRAQMWRTLRYVLNNGLKHGT